MFHPEPQWLALLAWKLSGLHLSTEDTRCPVAGCTAASHSWLIIHSVSVWQQVEALCRVEQRQWPWSICYHYPSYPISWCFSSLSRIFHLWPFLATAPLLLTSRERYLLLPPGWAPNHWPHQSVQGRTSSFRLPYSWLGLSIGLACSSPRSLQTAVEGTSLGCAF